MMYERNAGSRETPGLEDYLAAIRQRKWLVLLSAALVIALTVLFTSIRTPSYTATARVIVNPTAVGSTDGRLVRPVLEREREEIVSIAVADRAAQTLTVQQSGRSLLPDLEVVFVDSSDSLELRYTNESPELAQQVVNAFAQQYVVLRVERADALDAVTIEELRAKIAAINAQVADLEAQISTAGAERARLARAEQDTGAVSDQIATLRTSISALLVDRRAPVNDLADAELSASTRVPPAEVLELSSGPEVPDGLSDRILWFVGGILGLGLGVALAFVLHRLDRTARDTGDVELALGTSVLASIPSFGVAYRGGSSAIVMLSGGKSARVQRAREAFRRLRSSVQFLGTTRDADTFLITSARPAEGKSTTSANLAIALAQGETKVCLVNADLRRPTIEKVLGIPSTQQGLGDWLSDQSITNIMVPVPGTSGLVVVPSGPPVTNPGELFATNRFASLMDELSDQFDIILVDAPPVLSTADASAIARSVDGTIVVVDSSRTDTDTLLKVRAEIDRAGGTVVGAILNRDNSDGGGGVLRKDRYAYEKVTAARASS